MKAGNKNPEVETRATTITKFLYSTTQTGQGLVPVRNRSMRNIDLMRKLNVAYPPTAVRDLRQAGIEIQAWRHPHHSKPGEKIKRHHLISVG